MYISEFARERGQEPQAVLRYVSRHPEIKKFTHKDGKMVRLLPEAIELLDKIYPVRSSAPVVIGIPEEEHRKTLEDLAKEREESKQAYKQISALKDEISELSGRIATAEVTAVLLEDKEKQLKREEDRVKELEDNIRSLQEELAKEREKSWLQKLLGK